MACRLLARLSGWGAIKVTPTELYSTIIDDPAVLREPGKDTALMLEAGAEEVLWIKAPREGVAEALETATERLGHLNGVVVEGNSAVEVLRPDVILFIASGSTRGRSGAHRRCSRWPTWCSLPTGRPTARRPVPGPLAGTTPMGTLNSSLKPWERHMSESDKGKEAPSAKADELKAHIDGCEPGLT